MLQTVVGANGQSTTTLYRNIRANREDRVAKFEWASNGGLGRLLMGKVLNVFGCTQGPTLTYILHPDHAGNG